MIQSQNSSKLSVHRNRLHFGVLNDSKLEKLRKLGLLSGPKKTLSNSLKMAAVKATVLYLLIQLKHSFSPLIRLFYAYFFGLPLSSIKFLHQRLHKLNFLETFSLQLVICTPDDFTKNGLFLLGRSIRKFQRLRVLHFELEGKFTLPKDALPSFARDLMHLTNLTDVMIGFKFFSFDKLGIDKVFKALGKLTKLHQLELNIAETYCPGDKGLLQLSEQLKHLKNLASLALNVDTSPNIGVGNLMNFFSKLPNATNLRSLDLSLLNCGVASQDIKALVGALDEMRGLEYLKLLMYSNGLISAEDYGRLWDALGELEKLLVLEIRSGAVQNKFALEKVGFGKLGMAIGRLKTLKKINITLRGSAEVSNEDMLNLGTEICRAENLEDIEVHVMQFSLVMSTGMMELKEMLKGMSKNPKLTIRC